MARAIRAIRGGRAWYLYQCDSDAGAGEVGFPFGNWNQTIKWRATSVQWRQRIPLSGPMAPGAIMIIIG